MDIGQKTTHLTILTGVIWIIIPVLGWMDYWYPALFLCVLLMMLYLVMGTAHNGRVHPKMLAIILAFGVSWSSAFLLAQHHAVMFQGSAPAFTILGFHPSFFWILLFYWVGGVIPLAFGYYFCADAWLSREDWESFIKKIEALNAEE